MKYEVLTAENGIKGLEVLNIYPDVAVVISDMKMPVMNGLEFIIEPIKEKFPPYESVWEPAIQEPYILRQLTTQYLGIICKVFGKSKLLRLKFPKNGKKLIIFGDGWEENIGLIMPCRIEGTTDDIQED